MSLIDRVDPAQRKLDCPTCGELVAPRLSESGSHIRADCPQCGRYIKFVRQILPPAERAYWDRRKQ